MGKDSEAISFFLLLFLLFGGKQSFSVTRKGNKS